MVSFREFAMWAQMPISGFEYDQFSMSGSHDDGRAVFDDVIYLKDNDRSVEGRLSQALSSECDGPHWVGLSDRKNESQ